MHIERQLFTCKRDSLMIRGVQFLPRDYEEGKKYPAVIISHGFTGNYTDVEDFCGDFAKLGYAAFCFSFCGGSRTETAEELKSEGRTTDMTIRTEVRDLLAVMEYVQRQSFTDNGRIILMGFSQGGFVSGLAAAECPDKIYRLIMIFPALCIPDHARRGCLGGAHYDTNNVPEEIDCGQIVLGKAIHDETVCMEPYLELSAYKGKVLIIHGMEDEVVDYTYSVRAHANYGKEQCSLQLVRHMGHWINDYNHESIVASIRQFLADMKEILTFSVIITHCETETVGDTLKKDVYFTGYCDTEYFRGVIVPEGCDRQEYIQGVQTKIKAEYTLQGMDCEGEGCSLHVINQRSGDELRPIINTDSKALSWITEAELTSVIEYGKDELTVRIYAALR